jgi:hypothetical protein
MALFRQEGEGVPARKAAPIPCGKANMRDIVPNQPLQPTGPASWLSEVYSLCSRPGG